eukprot:7367255-Alexandrium_andersonii.AAC.1
MASGVRNLNCAGPDKISKLASETPEASFCAIVPDGCGGGDDTGRRARRRRFSGGGSGVAEPPHGKIYEAA